MQQKLIYGILVLAICALFAYLALLVGCDHCISGGPQFAEIYLTATHISNLNATTEVHMLETQAAITPTTIELFHTVTLTAP